MVGAFSPSTGIYLGVFATKGANSGIGSLTTASNGDIFVADWTPSNTTVIQRYSASGALLSGFANVTDLVLDMSVGPNGNLYTLEQGSGTKVNEFNGTTGALVSTRVADFNGDLTMETAPNGNLLVGGQGVMYVYSATGTLINTIGLPGTSLGLLVAANGNVYISTAGPAYGAPSNIYKCAGCQTGTGSFSLFGTDPNAGNLQDLIFGPGGSQLLVASRFSNTILKFDSTTGSYLGILGNTAPNLNGPYKLALTTSDGPFNTPEPGSMLTFAAGLLLLGGLRKRIRKTVCRPA